MKKNLLSKSWISLQSKLNPVSLLQRLGFINLKTKVVVGQGSELEVEVYGIFYVDQRHLNIGFTLLD